MKLMKPEKSYIIWFSQRTGSTVLCKALESTGVAGIPEEWFLNSNLKEQYQAASYSELQQKIWKKGISKNGVFGAKISFYQPHNDEIINTLKKFPGGKSCTNRAELWENAFPNCKHIFMTRRNKIRLAVSWWKAIKTGEFHRKKGDTPEKIKLDGKYSFDAINHLLLDCVFREAGIQEFFMEDNIKPLTIVYEDFIQEYENTIYEILDFLEIPERDQIKVDSPYFEKLADDISEKWVQKFREERQKDWDNKGW
ncbi:MAG: Stf0 family sulfotransferase [Bacillota bacterium]